MADRLTHAQQHLLDTLWTAPNRGFDCDELARLTETTPQGAARTASSLVRRGLVDRFVGGVGPQRVHFQVRLDVEGDE